MGRKLRLVPPSPTHAGCTSPRSIAMRGWRASRAMVTMAVTVALASCTTLPDPRLDPEGRETVHSVVEMAPGWWHVLVRVNYFSSGEAAERLLRERVADLCPEGDLVLENVQVVGNPRIATADAHCAGAAPPPETAAAPLPDDQAGSPSEDEGDTEPTAP